VRRLVGTLAALAAAIVCDQAAAVQYGILPAPSTPVRAVPPLTATGGVAGLVEKRVPGRIRATENVLVTVDRSGRPVRIVASIRLVLRGTGDYSLTIPAPVEDVAPGPGTASAPGLRRGAILWQGFSTRGRVLAARVTLRAAAAAGALPVRLRPSGQGWVVENAATGHTRALAATAPPSAVATVLNQAYAAVSRGQSFNAPSVRLSGPAHARPVRVLLPLTVRAAGRSAVLAETPVHVGKLPLEVKPPGAAEQLRPPDGRAWRSASVATAVDRLLRASLASAFRTYLLNPDPLGATTTTYRFVLGTAPVAAPTTATSGGDAFAWLNVALATLFGAALVAGVFVWARS
jgi:hypothetical protein